VVVGVVVIVVNKLSWRRSLVIVPKDWLLSLRVIMVGAGCGGASDDDEE
jgi:hypothetical protein